MCSNDVSSHSTIIKYAPSIHIKTLLLSAPFGKHFYQFSRLLVRAAMPYMGASLHTVCRHDR